MQSSIYVALSAQRSLLRRLESLANNVANATTPGFRSQDISFASHISEVTSDPVAFATTGQDYLSRRSGAITKTDAPLDLAIAGDAWFAVETAGGMVYTRDGRFQLDAEGALVTVTGGRVLDAGGTPLQINPTGGRPVIARDGTITQDGRAIGAIGLFQIAADARLERAPGGVTSDQPAVVQLDFNAVSVAQGFIERSNVDPVLEMTRLVTLQRTFDAISNTVADVENSISESVRILGG